MMDLINPAHAEYRIGADNSISLYIQGEPAKLTGGTGHLPNLRTRKRAVAVLDLLHAAMLRGAEHGPCDDQQEMASVLLGHGRPGHVLLRTDAGLADAGQKGARVEMAADHRAPYETVLDGIRPLYLASMIVNEMERAFTVGGFYGAPRTGFYVSIRRGNRAGHLLGPYATKPHAERNVDRAREAAEAVDAAAGFDAFGVCRVVVKPGAALPKGLLNDRVGLNG